jgi:hypothetical protein
VTVPKSQNGWPVVPRSAVDESPLIRNVKVPNGVLKGDVAIIFRWLVEQYDRRVERVIPGWCWGWFVKNIEGSSTISNHASATAIDINAPDNPMGSGTTRKSMTAAQIAECHALEDESDNVLRWGGDFGRNDPMHWEIVGSRAACRAFVAKITRTVEPPRKVENMEIVAKMPVLKQGDRDDRLGGYNLITRVQRIVGADDDGIWGPGTTDAIARWVKKSPAECRVMTEPLWRNLLGLG